VQAREQEPFHEILGRRFCQLARERLDPNAELIAFAPQELYLTLEQRERRQRARADESVSECVVRLRAASVWELVAAVGRRDAGAALSALADVYDPQDRGLRLLGVLAWSTRQLLRFESAIRAGASPDQAAIRAGAPPFKARELSQQLKNLPRAELERWPELLASIDFELKGGSRRPAQAVLESAILRLCRTPAPAPRAAAR
jgi:hypothetical protein